MVELKLVGRSDFEKYVDGCLELFRSRFTVPVKKEDFIWRYLKSPYEDVNVAIAVDGEKVVGFIGTMPNRIKVGDEDVKAAMFTNMMTHSDYCGQGIFSRMLNMLEKELKKKQYGFIYTFPNYQSNHILIEHHKWKDIYEIPRLELKQENVKICEEIEYSGIIKDNSFFLDYSETTKKLGEKEFIHAPEWRKWRIKDNPACIYDNFALQKESKVQAFITVRKYKDEYNIVDFSYNQIEQMEVLVEKVKRTFVDIAYKYLTVWCPINTKVHTMFEKQGFINRYPVTYFAGKSLNETRVNQFFDLTNWNGWFIHAIDDNIY